MNDKILEDILMECYWDTNMDKSFLEDIFKKQDKRELKKVFSKIIYNSKDKLVALSLFESNMLQEFFDSFEITYNKRYIKKHISALQWLLFGKKVEGLEWKKR
jgi:hypothetical protein